jgi:hypothetical protein
MSRWQIKIDFRVLKSGCKVEESQLETAARFEPYLALCQIVAWRVMHLMMLGREWFLRPFRPERTTHLPKRGNDPERFDGIGGHSLRATGGLGRKRLDPSFSGSTPGLNFSRQRA